MPEKAWKRFERTVAEKVGGIRVPVTGLDRDGADVIAPPFHYQCKLRKNVPVYLTTWLDGITATAAQSGSTGVVVWRAPGTLNDDALVIMKLSDWQALHGNDQAVQKHLAVDRREVNKVILTGPKCQRPASFQNGPLGLDTTC